MTTPAAEPHPSPNHGERTEGPVDILLLHYTGMPDHERSLAWLCNPQSGVSAHYFVCEDGRVFSLVPEDRRAWHAGRSRWGDTRDVNSRSIGIEIANAGHPGGLPDFPDGQIAGVIALCRDIVGRHPIPPHRVLAHSDVAPGRKIDPGEKFPWTHLAAAGIGHWVEPEPLAATGDTSQPGESAGSVEALQQMLALYGYGIEITGDLDRQTEAVVAAFQSHFRPARVDGIADGPTLTTLRRLIAALP